MMMELVMLAAALSTPTIPLTTTAVIAIRVASRPPGPAGSSLIRNIYRVDPRRVSCSSSRVKPPCRGLRAAVLSPMRRTASASRSGALRSTGRSDHRAASFASYGGGACQGADDSDGGRPSLRGRDVVWLLDRDD